MQEINYLTKKNGESIKKHQWFKHLDWEKIFAKEISPPWSPEIESERDTNNFIIYDGIYPLFSVDRKLPEEFQVFFEDF